MIHYISPFRTDKNIGLALNEAIKQLNAAPNDWIVHIDQDVLWLRSDSKAQLIEVLESTEYDILGCATNRLANDYQLVTNYGGESVFENSDIRFHIEIANLLHKTQYGNVIPFEHVLAAFCLCFRVSTWKLLGRFQEETIAFDTAFSLDAQQKGLKLGLITGIYLFHAYRLNSTNPKYDIKHLLA